MRVDLAYPYIDSDGVRHAPDETVDLPVDQGRRLIRGGRARPAADTAVRPENPAPERTTEPNAESGADEGKNKQ